MKIETRTRNDVTILDLRGRVVLGEPTKLLRETINDLVDAGKKNLVPARVCFEIFQASHDPPLGDICEGL